MSADKVFKTRLFRLLNALFLVSNIIKDVKEGYRFFGLYVYIYVEMNVYTVTSSSLVYLPFPFYFQSCRQDFMVFRTVIFHTLRLGLQSLLIFNSPKGYCDFIPLLLLYYKNSSLFAGDAELIVF